MWFCSYQFLFFNTGTVTLLTWLPSFTVLISVSVLTDGKIPTPVLQLRAGASVSRCSVLLRHSLISSAELFAILLLLTTQLCVGWFEETWKCMRLSSLCLYMGFLLV